jgi:acetyl-CoA carboxylase carboxyl transferase subunit alpha
MDYLAFEQPLAELAADIQRQEKELDGSNQAQETLRSMRQQLNQLTREIYADLKPWQIVQVARHKDRPHTTDYLSLIFDEFVELHGDKLFGDDRAIRTGFANLENTKVMIVGHQKGRTFQDRTENSFGCAHPEGYRKAMKKMRLAAKFKLPVITFIDTPGAYPGIGAEQRGQAQVIAENMFEMSRLPTPIICVVIGEGGSGGALGIGVGDRVAILEHAYYSVISPEGCAGILWKSAEHAEKAANALRFTSKDLLHFGIVDEVIAEPLGGAHRDHHRMSAAIKAYLKRTLANLKRLDLETLLQQRYERFRRLGVFLESPSEANNHLTAG